jgi:hypothetical protein
MPENRTLWVHPASYTYSFDRPEKTIETLWSARKGWGYLKRRDMWISRNMSPEELETYGYEALKPPDNAAVKICAHCGLYMCDIPGSLMSKHIAECGGLGEDWLALEDAVVHDIRVRKYHAKILAQKIQEQQELEEQEKRDRFDRIREDAANRQSAKDRKKRLKLETREELRNR